MKKSKWGTIIKDGEEWMVLSSKPNHDPLTGAIRWNMENYVFEKFDGANWLPVEKIIALSGEILKKEFYMVDIESDTEYFWDQKKSLEILVQQKSSGPQEWLQQLPKKKFPKKKTDYLF